MAHSNNEHQKTATNESDSKINRTAKSNKTGKTSKTSKTSHVLNMINGYSGQMNPKLTINESEASTHYESNARLYNEQEAEKFVDLAHTPINEPKHEIEAQTAPKIEEEVAKTAPHEKQEAKAEQDKAFVNMVEVIAGELASDFLQRFNRCACEKCQQYLIDSATNEISARYVSSDKVKDDLPLVQALKGNILKAFSKKVLDNKKRTPFHNKV